VSKRVEQNLEMRNVNEKNKSDHVASKYNNKNNANRSSSAIDPTRDGYADSKLGFVAAHPIMIHDWGKYYSNKRN
jgi:hypothetical protein